MTNNPDGLSDARALSRQLAYAFCGKLKQSQKADVSERLGIKLDYSLTALERDKRFLRAVVDAGAVGILEAAVSSFLPDEFTTLPASTSTAIAAGMKAWAGGDAAPEDWDGGPVLRQDGRMEHSDDITKQQWRSPVRGCKWNIVAYTAAAPKAASVADQLRADLHNVQRNTAIYRQEAKDRADAADRRAADANARADAAVEANRRLVAMMESPKAASEDGAGEAQCKVPPDGWRCTRTPGHDGPCAAVPTYDDLEDEIAEAINDSLDMDWTGSVGARHVMGLLRDKGIVA